MTSYLRDPNPQPGPGKSIINTALAKSLYNHGVYTTLSGKFYDIIVDPKLGKTFHYRDNLQGERSRQKAISQVILFVKHVHHTEL